MGRTLASIGARLGMPKPVVLCPWPRDARERERVLAEIRRLESRASSEEPVLYSDEVDIHLNPKDLHANVTRNHRCKSMRHLLGNCRRYLEGYRWRRVAGAAVLARAA
jgi:hypothetical protein